MVFLIIGLGILFYGKKNFKKSFMLFLCYRLFLVTNITILSIPGVPLLTLDFFMSFIYVCIFFLNGKKYQMATMAFPYRRSFKIVVFSMTLSSIFAVAGFAAESTALVGAIVQNYLMTWLIWQMVNDKEDFDYLFKCMTIVFLLSCIYALFEYTIKSNPLQLYEATLNPTKTIDYSYSHDTRRGYRARSIFEHPIGAGINWAVYAVFSLSLYVQRKNFPHATTSIITTFLCFICILLTKMRSPLIFLFIAIIGIVNFKEKSFIFLHCSWSYYLLYAGRFS